MTPFQFADHRDRLNKILVIELLGLGDNVHLIPALEQLRAALPKAQIHVMCRAHVSELFSCTPWVDRVWGYPVQPRRPTVAEHRKLIGEIRRADFDMVLNISSNDRSTWLTGLSGAPRRVGRVPRKGRRLHWRLFHNYEIQAPYGDRPTWRQKTEALTRAGVPATNGPAFNVERPALPRVDPRVRWLDGQRYLHISPFAAEDRRGLMENQTIAMLNAVHAIDPAMGLVISIGPTEREKRKWQGIQDGLEFTPLALFAGDLDTASFLRLIAGASLHVGPDSGGLHVARMFDVPTVCWMRQRVSREWIDDQPLSKTLLSDVDSNSGLTDIRGETVANAVAQTLTDLASSRGR